MSLTNNNFRLMQAITSNNREDIVRWALESLKEDKTQKNERWVKNYIEKLTEASNNIYEVPYNLKGFISMEQPRDTFLVERYYSTAKDEEMLNKILNMHQVGMQLEEMKIPYNNTTILYGPSGTGKTTFGRYIAYKLEMPFIYLNFSQVVDSYMGSTSKNLSKIFDFVKSVPCVFMLDEIDCISIKRSGTDGSGASEELARITVSLMQELDRLSNNHIILAATNRLDRMDEAILRRFSVRYYMDVPTTENKREMIKKYINSLYVYNESFQEFMNDNYINSVVEKSKTQADVINNIVVSVADFILQENTINKV